MRIENAIYIIRKMGGWRENARASEQPSKQLNECVSVGHDKFTHTNTKHTSRWTSFASSKINRFRFATRANKLLFGEKKRRGVRFHFLRYFPFKSLLLLLYSSRAAEYQKLLFQIMIMIHITFRRPSIAQIIQCSLENVKRFFCWFCFSDAYFGTPFVFVVVVVVQCYRIVINWQKWCVWR